MTYYKAPADAVLEKEDGSPVTKADREAERYIIGELERIFPGIPCIGEESACSNDRPSQLERYWCIDPLDGTREFISERPEFTVNIALVENGYPILGAIFAPALDVMYMGSLREGSFRSDKQGDLMKLPVYLGEKPFTVVISRARPTAGAEAEFLEMLREKRGEVDEELLDSSLKFFMVDDGSADIYFRAGRTMF